MSRSLLLISMLSIFTQLQCPVSAQIKASPNVVRYRQLHVVESEGKKITEAVSTMYADLKGPRFRNEQILSDGAESISVQDLQIGRTLITNSHTRVATRIAPPAIAVETFKSFLEYVSELKRNTKATAETLTIDGRETVKFVLRDGPTTSTTVWIDKQSDLPVRFELENVNPVTAGAVNRYVYSDFSWISTAKESEKLFATSTPEGFVTEDRSCAENYPKNLAALQKLETQIVGVIKEVLPAVVQVNDGTGVIVTSEGLVVSQWHVSHAEGAKPGQRVKITLQDGTQRNAELLGADLTHDLSLLQIVEPSPYAFTPLGDSDGVKLGDGVLKIGHPLSASNPGRGPVARFGRVVCCDSVSLTKHGSFVTDCRTNGGDSGGPLYDLNGRLIGIIHKSALVQLYDGAASQIAQRHGVPFAYTSSAFVRERLPKMLKSEVLPADESQKAEAIASLRKATRLPLDCWKLGATSALPYHEIVQRIRRSIVTVCDGDGGTVALGAVVAPDGWVVTKASVLPLRPQCRLHDGRIVAAKIVGIKDNIDIALLKLSAAGLEPVAWGDRNPAVGTLVVAPGAQSVPLPTGVISVARRDVLSALRTIIEHDCGLSPQECGGPVVDLHGQVIGINVSQAAHSCVAIPGDVIEQALPELKSGKLSPRLDE